MGFLDASHYLEVSDSKGFPTQKHRGGEGEWGLETALFERKRRGQKASWSEKLEWGGHWSRLPWPWKVVQQPHPLPSICPHNLLVV